MVGVQYIDSEGEMRSASISTPEDISRIRCCIGLCGIIYDITLRVNTYMYFVSMLDYHIISDQGSYHTHFVESYY